MTEPSVALAPGFTPTRVLEVELSDPLPDVEPAESPRGQLYTTALVFVRLHSEPIVLTEVQLRQGSLSAQELSDTLWPHVASRVAAHLAADGIETPTGLDPSGISVPDGDAPSCERARDEFLRSAPTLSVLLPSRERPERLRSCLESILACEYPSDRVRLIVVDNAPVTSATRDLVTTYRDRADITYVREDVTGSASARNRGLKEVETEIVVMTDDDTVVDRHWLTEIARTFDAFQDAAAVSGLLIPMELDTPAQLWFEQWGGFGRGVDTRVFDLGENWPEEEPLYPWTAGIFGTANNFAFRAQALRDVCAFDPALGNGTPALGGVDTEVMLRTILSGHQIVYQPRAIVHHAHRVDYDSLRRQIYGYGAGLAAVWLKTLLANPRLFLDFARKAGRGLRFALSPTSPKNAKKRSSYPRELTWLELRGMLYGPLAYSRSRRKYGPHRVPRAQIPRRPPRVSESGMSGR
jgi:GT2 family glycosyltransferase